MNQGFECNVCDSLSFPLTELKVRKSCALVICHLDELLSIILGLKRVP